MLFRPFSIVLLIALLIACESHKEQIVPSKAYMQVNNLLYQLDQNRWIARSDGFTDIQVIDLKANKIVLSYRTALKLHSNQMVTMGCYHDKQALFWISTRDSSKSLPSTLTTPNGHYLVDNALEPFGYRPAPDTEKASESLAVCRNTERPLVQGGRYSGRARIDNVPSFDDTPEQWKLAVNLYDDSGNHIEQRTLGAGPWVYEHGFFKQISCFSCGCSCYQKLTAYTAKNKVFVTVWGRAVDPDLQGVWAHQNGDWVKVLHGEIHELHRYGSDACEVIYVTSDLVHRARIC